MDGELRYAVWGHGLGFLSQSLPVSGLGGGVGGQKDELSLPPTPNSCEPTLLVVTGGHKCQRSYVHLDG